ncbi:MAG: ketopantoate reductase family protein [Candidatus Thorarchaeota archaeon]
MQIAVIGAGAIGGVIAAHLTRAGENVEVVCKHDDLAQVLSSRGIHIKGVAGTHIVKLDAKAKVNQLSGPQEIIFLATKTADVLEAANTLLPFLHEDSMVVTLQNGIVEEAVGEIIGRNRVVGCVVNWGSTVIEPGEIQQTSHGLFVIGELDGSLSERLNAVKKLLECIEPVKISENIFGALYTKLVINSSINSLGAISGLFLGKMMAIKKAREIFLGVAREGLEVAKATNLKPEKIEKLNPQSFAGGPSFKKHLLLRYIGFKYRKIKSSSLQSLERGRLTEIDYLNGYIIRRGEAAGVETPINHAIAEMVKEIEQGKREITPTNIDELFERAIGLP